MFINVKINSVSEREREREREGERERERKEFFQMFCQKIPHKSRRS